MEKGCLNCINFNREKWGTCKAFPNGISFDITSGEFDHTVKHPDQKNDIVFEPIEEKK